MSAFPDRSSRSGRANPCDSRIARPCAEPRNRAKSRAGPAFGPFATTPSACASGGATSSGSSITRRLEPRAADRATRAASTFAEDTNSKASRTVFARTNFGASLSQSEARSSAAFAAAPYGANSGLAMATRLIPSPARSSSDRIASAPSAATRTSRPFA
ncbi:MAG: hypothetical protein U0800_13110 [Isosphaeraceae bacterium]